MSPTRADVAVCPPPTAPDDPVALYAVDATGTGRAVTRRELTDQVDRVTAAMRRLGVRPGDRVALQLPLVPEAVAALLACTRIGAVATTPTPSAPPLHDPSDELARRRLRRVRLLVTADDRRPTGSRTAPPGSPQVLVLPTGSGPARRHLALAAPPARSSRPVPAPEENAAGLRLGLRGPADVYWCAADLDWLVRHPLAVAGPLALGAAQVLCQDSARSAHPERLLETLHTYRVTVLHARPDSLQEVLRHSPATGLPTLPAPDLRLVAPVPELADFPGPDHWYWQREHLPSPSWHLRHGPSPWSLRPSAVPADSLPGQQDTLARP
ncbi:AMP-binding protein [Kitasatospora sp. NPDC056181]|uniref:AMP-binding protein n=1 Tax=Kitasatospora sp. NPDC056181 TaxID=3345737 RepID=UPI0035E097BC